MATISGMTALGAGTFIAVFARAIQQQNVIGGHYIAAAITSFAIAAGDVILITGVALNGIAAFPVVGAGGAVGSVLAMWVHRRFTKPCR